MDAQIMDMPRATYDDLRGRANFSILKHLARSPAHCLAAMRERGEDSDALKVGRATHLAIFEPDVYRAEVVTWTGGRRAGKDWDAYERRHDGKEILTQAEAEFVDAVANAVRSNTDAAALLEPRIFGGKRYDGKCEQTLLWTDAVTGVECKGRLDFLSPQDAIVDLKSTKDAQPEAFARSAWSLHYHVQAAFYADALHAVTGERVPFFIIAVEKTAPFVVQVYEVPAELLAIGRFAYRRWLAQFDECRQTGVWPGYALGPIPLTAPRWADKSSAAADEETDE